jgi:hypothetical protein
MTKWKEWELKILKDLLARFTKIESTVSVVVQGPLHPRMEESLPHYLDLVKRNSHNGRGNLVISHWEGDHQGAVEEFLEDPTVCFVGNKYEDLPRYKKNLANRGPNPWLYQNHTTHQGLVQATGHFSIKVRSDEIFPALHLFHDEHLKPGNSPRFLTSDIYFRPDAHEKFHPSDHIIAGLTHRLRRGFDKARVISASKRRAEFSFPEQLICHALLESIGVKPKEYKSRAIMKKHFGVIPIARMQGSIWTASYRKYRPMTVKEDGWVQHISDL